MKGTRTEQDRVGVIGGSGLYDIEGLKSVRRVQVRTPFGSPSDAITVGTLQGVAVAFLSRHGRGHRFNPSEINYRANIYALKSLGVTRVISVSAVGSMKESIRPGDVVMPDQFIDLTKRRASTFFEGGMVAHVAFGEPICGSLARSVFSAGQQVGATLHRGGTYLCMEGPQFSTKAESRLYRQWGVDVIGMTNMPEAKLAREAELCYATMALVTDYDCWHETEEAVTVEAILDTLHHNVALAKRIVQAVLPSLAECPGCACGQSLDNAIVTDRRSVSASTKKRLRPADTPRLRAEERSGVSHGKIVGGRIRRAGYGQNPLRRGHGDSGRVGDLFLNRRQLFYLGRAHRRGGRRLSSSSILRFSRAGGLISPVWNGVPGQLFVGRVNTRIS